MVRIGRRFLFPKKEVWIPWSVIFSCLVGGNLVVVSLTVRFFAAIINKILFEMVASLYLGSILCVFLHLVIFNNLHEATTIVSVNKELSALVAFSPLLPFPFWKPFLDLGIKEVQILLARTQGTG